VAPSDWRDAIYYAYYENDSVHEVAVHDGIRTDRYKLMFFPRTNEWNLFDLETDPQEMKSVHDDPAYQTILAGLQQRYRDVRNFYAVNSATIPVTRGDEAWWKQRDREKSALAKERAYDLIFIGDSITQGWEEAGAAAWEKHFAGIPSLNLGFSGDRTEHVLWRLSQSQMGISQPKVVVVLIGTNNTGHRLQPPTEVAAGVTQIVAAVQNHSPQTKVLLMAILPRGESRFDKMRLNNTAINDHLRRLDDGQSVFYRDLSPLFVLPDGSLRRELMPDLLHLNEPGYEAWAEALVPMLRELQVYPE
jgi:N-acetylglucosamine-6-sulfatase